MPSKGAGSDSKPIELQWALWRLVEHWVDDWTLWTSIGCSWHFASRIWNINWTIEVQCWPAGLIASIGLLNVNWSSLESIEAQLASLKAWKLHWTSLDFKGRFKLGSWITWKFVGIGFWTRRTRIAQLFDWSIGELKWASKLNGRLWSSIEALDVNWTSKRLFEHRSSL